jgi:exodeoxyribonuclease V alpha subunit
MEQASDRTASTIHRLLEIDFVDEEGTMLFSKNRQNPLETDVVIIDEMSMVDIELMHSLLQAIRPGTRLILIGDVDQLPAVGPGNVLHDIIESGIIPCTILEKIYRQETGNMIPLVARDINEGKVPDLITPDRSFEFKPCHNPRDMVREVIKIISRESAENDDIQVIIPGKKGFAGTMNMNRLLQAEFNPPSEWKKEKEYGSRVFREGDKVMQIKNNYELEYRVGFEDGKGIFNGDIGIVMSIDADGGFMEIVFDGGRRVSYDIRDADQLDTAYAITVHKSQGSEYNTVILVLMGVSPMLQTRNLLYTAVSRAVDKLYIVGQGEILRSMVANENKKKRYSGLVNLLV